MERASTAGFAQLRRVIPGGLRLRRLVAACLTTSAVLGALAGCGVNSTSDPLQVTNQLVAATPASSPALIRPPAGTVHPAAAVDLAAFDPASSTLALASGNSITLRPADAPADASRTIQLPGPAASLHPARGGLLAAVPGSNVVARIDSRAGTATMIPVAGGPVAAIESGGELAVALRETKSVVFLRGGQITRTVSGFAGPAQLLTAGGDVFVLDRLSTALISINPGSSEKGTGLRAGGGATNATTDRFGRMLVTDTRGGQLLAFSAEPLILKQRFPVPGAPYAIAYDPARDLAWVTLTSSNEVVGYDVAGGEPVERYRVPSVHQPNAVAVNPVSGEVFVGSAAGDGLQVVKP